MDYCTAARRALHRHILLVLRSGVQPGRAAGQIVLCANPATHAVVLEHRRAEFVVVGIIFGLDEHLQSAASTVSRGGRSFNNVSISVRRICAVAKEIREHFFDGLIRRAG